MKSPKSASASPRRSKHDPKHFFKRRPRYREYRIEDERWLWANWKTINPEGTREEFAATVLPNIDARLNGGCTLFTIIAPVDGHERAVAIVTAIPIDGSYDMMEPHVTWFSWATARNKFETTLWFMEGMRKMWDMYIVAPETEAPFFDRISKYHVLRKVGKWERRLDGKDAHLYQSRRY